MRKRLKRDFTHRYSQIHTDIDTHIQTSCSTLVMKEIQIKTNLSCHSLTLSTGEQYCAVTLEHSLEVSYLVQFSSATQSCLTLCNPTDRTPGLPVHHQVLEFTQTHVYWVSDAIQPFHPQSSPSPPAFKLSYTVKQKPILWLSNFTARCLFIIAKSGII